MKISIVAFWIGRRVVWSHPEDEGDNFSEKLVTTYKTTGVTT